MLGPSEGVEPDLGVDSLALLLEASSRGDAEAFSRLVERCYASLRRVARAQLRRGRPDGLDTTALVHDAYLKMAAGAGVHARDGEHFLAVAARAMRQVVIDEVRARRASKRGAGERELTLRTSLVLLAEPEPDVVRVHAALERLERLDPRLARIVELRIFAGLTEAEVASALSISARTAQRDWRRAKAWLEVALESPE